MVVAVLGFSFCVRLFNAIVAKPFSQIGAILARALNGFRRLRFVYGSFKSICICSFRGLNILCFDLGLITLIGFRHTLERHTLAHAHRHTL